MDINDHTTTSAVIYLVVCKKINTYFALVEFVFVSVGGPILGFSPNVDSDKTLELGVNRRGFGEE